MAIIGKIRERSFLVLVIIGIALLAFMLTEYFTASSNGTAAPASLAEINGKSISPQEFEARIQKAYDNYAKQTGQELDERTRSSIRESVWNEISSDEIIGKEMDDLGIVVTSKELLDMVRGENPHPQVRQAFTDPNTGQFNADAVIQFLQNLDNDQTTKNQWMEFETAMKRNRRMEKYNTLVKKGIYTPKALATAAYNDNQTALAFKYIFKPYSSISDSAITVSESELKDKYNETKADYEQKASRKIAYAYFPVIPSTNDQEEAKNWIFNIYTKFQSNKNDSTFVNRNSDERFNPVYYSKANAPAGIDSMLWQQDSGYVMQPQLLGNTWTVYKVRNVKYAPDSVKARHILIGFQTRQKEAAGKTADSIITALNNGASFETLVEQSDDKASIENGGDLGWFAEGMMVKPFNDAAFTSELNKYVKVESQFGYHIIQVTEKLAPVKKIQIAKISREVKPSKETYEDLFNKATSFSINVTDMESFRNTLTAQNVQQRTAILRENDNLIQGLDASRELARWAKEAEEGDVSEAKDVDEAFVVAIVESVEKEGFAPLEKVRNRVEFLAKQDKKAAMIIKDFGSGSTIQEVANTTGEEVQNANVTFASPAIPNVGLEPKVVGIAMTLTPGQLSQPIQGINGVFMISVDKKVDAGQPDLTQVVASEERGITARIDNGAVFNALKEKATIKDNRSKFY